MDFSGKTVLIFGDSHSAGQGTPGYQLGERLAKAGAKAVSFDAKGGRSARSFLHSASDGGAAQLASDVAKKPDVVVIILGTNDAANLALSANPSAYLKADAADLQTIIAAFQQGGATVFVVGPPYWPDAVNPATVTTTALNKASETIASMERSIVGGRFLDARPMTKSIGLDGRAKAADGTYGVHFNTQGAAAWADAMAAALAASGLTFEKKVLAGGLAVAATAGVLALWWLIRRRQAHADYVKALTGERPELEI